MRILYTSLLWLHPPAFRRQFASEMLWIFDAARRAEGASVLLFDLLVSLVRQWFIRCGLWKVAAAMIGGVLQVAPALFVPPGRMRLAPLSFRAAPIEYQQFILLAICAVVFVLAGVLLTVLWSIRIARKAPGRRPKPGLKKPVFSRLS